MKKLTTIISTITVIILISLFITRPQLTGYSVYNKEVFEKVKLGYCSTIQKEAVSLSQENNYELVQFGSASEVLFALRNNQINKALIGRKAEKNEISSNTQEIILKSGYTLVSNQKSFIEHYKIPLIKVYTYLSNEVTSGLTLENSKIIYIDKEDIQNKIQEGKIVLISWDDWDDDFELIVFMNGNRKVKDFRGVFLYEN